MRWLLRAARWRRRHFTFYRWNHNPFQMWGLALLLQVSANQIFIGVSTASAISDYQRNSQLALSICNVVGGLITFWGLHLRGKTTALLVEACGYAGLIGSLGLYVWMVFIVMPMPNTSFGLGLSEAFVLASLHRAIIIFRPILSPHLQRFRRRHRKGEEVDPDEPLR